MEGKIENSPQPERDEQAEKLVDFLHKIKAEQVFGNDENKINFIKSLTFEDFKDWLERINGILRDKPIANREMDGKGVEISGALLGSEYTPPRQDDKEELLREVFESVQKTNNAKDIALLLSTAITAIHPFIDGNGRTSRFAFTLFDKDYEGTAEQDQYLKDILGDEGRLKLNTSSMLLDHYVGLEIYSEVGLDIEDKSVAKNLFPNWKQVRELNQNLSDEDFKILTTMAEDSFDQFIAVYKYLKNKGILEKYIKPIYRDNELVRTIIDLKVLMPDLTSDSIKEISETYWSLKKEKIEKMVDVFANPEQHLLPDAEKREDEKEKKITLKDRFSEEVRSTMKN